MDEKESTNDEQSPEGYDFVLEMLMNMARMNLPVPITVHSGGVIITGLLVTETEYLKEFAGGKIFDAMKRRVEGDEKLRERAEQTTDDPTEREFIHIKNAKFIFPNGQPFPEGTNLMWRGRVSSIDGYLPAMITS